MYSYTVVNLLFSAPGTALYRAPHDTQDFFFCAHYLLIHSLVLSQSCPQNNTSLYFLSAILINMLLLLSGQEVEKIFILWARFT